MRRKACYIARLEEVVITREGEVAIIRYTEEGIPTTHLTIGPEISAMSDETILECFNDTLRAQAQMAAEYRHVAEEIPLGSPQMEYHQGADQWSPRGNMVRCLIEDDETGQVIISIDDHEMDIQEFGKMLVTYAGWGMRIEFVPSDEVHRRPRHVVREPKSDWLP